VVDPGHWAGEGEQGCFEEGAVLDRAAALDPDPAGTVVTDPQEPGVVRGPLLTGELTLQAPVYGVGIDDLDQVASGLGQLGGIQRPGVVDQDRLALGPQHRAGGQGLHGGKDDVGLLG
jgi:hypothetical protein